jgi:hypothetical protein
MKIMLEFAQTYCSGDDLGLINLNGIVVTPRPHRASRAKRQRCGVTGSSPDATNLPVGDRRKNGAECLPTNQSSRHRIRLWP